MLEFARWKYTVVVLVSLLALVFAAPNFFGEDLAVQVARGDRVDIDPAASKAIEDAVKAKGLTVKRTYIDGGRTMLLFDTVGDQLAARDAVNEALSATYVSALSRAPRAPQIFLKMGLRPMPLGLDLRGGLNILYEVDVNSAVQQLLESYEQDYRRALTDAKIAFTDATLPKDEDGTVTGVRITFPPGANLTAARDVMRKVVSDAQYAISEGPVPGINATLDKTQLDAREKNAIQQNIVTLNKRVNELGVTEPEVRQQGKNRISVSLPGVTNSAEVKDILGKVATLEFRLTDWQNLQQAVATGRAPVGSRFDVLRDGRQTLLKRELIATGEQLVDASTTTGQDGRPAVSVRLNTQAGDRMLKVTQANLQRPMAVVLIEEVTEKVTNPITGVVENKTRKKREVISEATIQGTFGNQFQITGLGQGEARDLALLMRSGQLGASMTAISERAVGPSLGQQNIEAGVKALLIGSGLLFLFMILYYRLFGVVASVVLLGNVVLLTALLSMMKASLSLPGIAGILLTVGMAVDANVIIYERIREELRNGMSPQAAIRAGFEKAWSAIWDSNVTTFIAGLVLWGIGTGPIRNFAVVLVLGIMTSMFMAMLGSRALLTLIYGGSHKPARLSIG
jgi:preprotein translocase subunit SecD